MKNYPNGWEREVQNALLLHQLNLHTTRRCLQLVPPAVICATFVPISFALASRYRVTRVPGMSHRAFPTDLFAGYPGITVLSNQLQHTFLLRSVNQVIWIRVYFCSYASVFVGASRAGNKCQNYPSGWVLSGVHRLTLLAVNLLVKIKSGSSVVLQQGVMSGGVDVQGETFGREGSVID